MANIIKIPCVQYRDLLPFSDISNIKTYCTPYNFTYSMESDEHEWGEWTPSSPAWATTNYWMNRNLVPNSSDPSWSLTDNGNTVHLYHFRTSDGSGVITPYSSTQITCYIVGKKVGVGSSNSSLFWLSSDNTNPPPYDTYHHINLFDYKNNQIGIRYFYGATVTGSSYISPDPNREYHIFAFKWRYDLSECPCTLNVDGTSDSFQTPGGYSIKKIYFPASSVTANIDSSWDIKLIAFLKVAEPDEVIANNVNMLRMIYQ